MSSDALQRAIDRLGQEYVNATETGAPEDTAYNAAVSHCIGALRAMQEEALISAKPASAADAANPLGGPARKFEVMAERIRAGEDYDAVLADYGLCVRQASGSSDARRRIAKRPTVERSGAYYGDGYDDTLPPAQSGEGK